MDTINGFGTQDIPLDSNLFVPLTSHEAIRERQIYLSYISQVTDLPDNEMRDVFNVLNTTRRRGTQLRRITGNSAYKHAAVIFKPVNSKAHPLGKILPFVDVSRSPDMAMAA